MNKKKCQSSYGNFQDQEKFKVKALKSPSMENFRIKYVFFRINAE